jgi:hypothetical protein
VYLKKKLHIAGYFISNMKKLLFVKSIHFNKSIVLVFSCLLFRNFSGVSQSAWVNPEHTEENLMGLKKGWFVGADFGSNLFYGAITTYNNFPKLKDFKSSFGSGYSFYGGKKFKYGLSAEAQVFKGTIQGQKISPPLYPRYFTGEVLNYSINAKYNLSQLFFRDKQDRKFFNRLALYATVGFGQAFYRSILYKQATNNQWYIEKTTGYHTKGIDSAGIGSAGGVITSKAAMVSSFILPIGGKINYKLNKKTDIVIDIYYVTVFSKSVDSWTRTWTHDDKYLYTGIGLCYNFARTDADDLPEDQRVLRPGSLHHKVVTPDGDTGSSAEPEPEKKTYKKKSKMSKEDKDMEIKLKLYELQLKLFEMQFLTQ